MNKAFVFLSAYIAATAAFAQVEQPLTVMAKQDGTLAIPSPAAFKTANDIASAPKFFSVLVDTSPTISYLNGQKIDFFATDSELKVMSGDTLVYRASTIQDGNFASNPKSDLNCKIFFQCSEVLGDAAEGRRYWPFLNGVFESVGAQAKFMAGSDDYPEINNILFCPNVEGALVDGAPIGDIWNVNNAALQPTILRFNAIDYEQGKTGLYRWRIANPNIFYTPINSSVDMWIPEKESDWTKLSGGTPTFNEDGSITFNSDSEALAITQNNTPLDPGFIYIASFEVQTPAGAGGYIALYGVNAVPSNYNIYIQPGRTSPIIGNNYFRLIIYPGTEQWQQVRVLLKVSSSGTCRIYGGTTGNLSTVSIRNFKLIKL